MNENQNRLLVGKNSCKKSKANKFVKIAGRSIGRPSPDREITPHCVVVLQVSRLHFRYRMASTAIGGLLTGWLPCRALLQGIEIKRCLFANAFLFICLIKCIGDFRCCCCCSYYCLFIVAKHVNYYYL